MSRQSYWALAALAAVIWTIASVAHARPKPEQRLELPGPAIAPRAVWGTDTELYVAGEQALLRLERTTGRWTRILPHHGADWFSGALSNGRVVLGGVRQRTLWRWTGDAVQEHSADREFVHIAVDGTGSVWALEWAQDGGASTRLLEWTASDQLRTWTAPQLGLDRFAALGVDAAGHAWAVGRQGAMARTIQGQMQRTLNATKLDGPVTAAWHSASTQQTWLVTSKPSLVVRNADGTIHSSSRIQHSADHLVGTSIGGRDLVALVDATSSLLTDGRRAAPIAGRVAFIDGKSETIYALTSDQVRVLPLGEFLKPRRSGASRVRGKPVGAYKTGPVVLQSLNVGMGPRWELNPDARSVNYSLDVRYGLGLGFVGRHRRQIVYPVIRPELGYGFDRKRRHLFLAGLSAGLYTRWISASYFARFVAGRERNDGVFGLRHGLELAFAGGIVWTDVSHQLLYDPQLRSTDIRLLIGTNILAVLAAAGLGGD